MVVPFYWMAIGAFKSVPELTQQPPSFIPENPSYTNFFDPAWSATRQVAQHVQGLFQRYENLPLRFGTFMVNSLIIVTAITVIALLIASMAAYALTKTNLPGRQAIFMVIVSAIMVPWQVSLIPNFLIVKNLQWLDTYQGYIVPALPKAFVLFFLVQYLRSIPNELIHAARIDGASEWRIWRTVVMPLIRPAMAAMTIFVAIAEWNNFIWPLIIVNSQDMANIPVALTKLSATTYTDPQGFGVVMAASLLTSLPTIIFFLMFQKHFTRGIVISGLKG